jgi:hypothetical protein
MWTPPQRRRARWIGAVLMVGGGVLNLYASALAAFQTGSSCNEFGLTAPTWNCRQAAFYGLFGILFVLVGIAVVVASFLRRER